MVTSQTEPTNYYDTRRCHAMPCDAMRCHAMPCVLYLRVATPSRSARTQARTHINNNNSNKNNASELIAKAKRYKGWYGKRRKSSPGHQGRSPLVYTHTHYTRIHTPTSPHCCCCYCCWCCCLHIKSSFLPSFIDTPGVRPDSLS